MKINYPLSKFMVTGALVLALPGLANAASVFAIHDNFVRGGTNSATVQDGAGTTMLVKGESAGNASFTRKSWLRFDLTGQLADINQGAILTVTVSGIDSGGATDLQAYGLNAGYTASSQSGTQLGTSWDESAIAWDNAPGNDTGNTLGVDTSVMTQVGLTDASQTAGEVLTFSFPQLSDFIQADNTVTFAIIGTVAGSGTTGLRTSEWSTPAERPTLSFSQIPEPSSAALIGLSALACLIRRRR